MAQTNASMSTRPAGPAAHIISIQGDVTSQAENALMDAYTAASTQGARTIVLDFSRMDYMNSSGIGLLVTLLVRANRQGQRLLAYGLSEHYRHIFNITRLDEAIQLFASEADALASLGGR